MNGRTASARVVGGLDRILRGLAGCAVGTTLGGLFAAVVGTLLALQWQLPRMWGIWAACGIGLCTGVWSAARGRRPWFVPCRRRRGNPRRGGAAGFGWVDLVVRTGLGLCIGAYAGILAGITAMVWLLAFGLGDHPCAVVAWSCVLAIGALLGLVWFALDLPWFPGRRRSAGPRSIPSEDGGPDDAHASVARP